MSVALKQLRQDGATNGEAIVWNASSETWEPGDTIVGGSVGLLIFKVDGGLVYDSDGDLLLKETE